jgi:hypothetical protein
MFLIRVAKYRLHRPHCHECKDFQVFRAGGTIPGYRPPVDRYRPPRQMPPAYRPRRNVAFCRYFCYTNGTAVDASDDFMGFVLC